MPSPRHCIFKIRKSLPHSVKALQVTDVKKAPCVLRPSQRPLDFSGFRKNSKFLKQSLQLVGFVCLFCSTGGLIYVFSNGLPAMPMSKFPPQCTSPMGLELPMTSF
jgi:hypothetical protein